jgi:putative transposase
MNSLRLGLDDGPQRPKPSSNPGIWIRNNKPDHGKSANLPALTSLPWCYGPEFVAVDLRKWLAATGAKTPYIEPGSPWENGYCESFNSKLSDEFPNGEIFYSIKELRVLVERWRVHFNTLRPRSSLGYRPPTPETWLAKYNKGHGEVENATRIPLLHTPDDGGYLNSEITALH